MTDKTVDTEDKGVDPRDDGYSGVQNPEEKAPEEKAPEEKPAVPEVAPGMILVQISSAALRNLYAAYMFANERGTFGGQPLENQQLMMAAAMSAKITLDQFDEMMVTTGRMQQQGQRLPTGPVPPPSA